MRLTDKQLVDLDRDGFLVLPELFSSEEVDAIQCRMPALLAESHEANVVEKTSGQVRTTMGLHQRDELFARLVRHPRLVEPARQIRPGAL